MNITSNRRRSATADGALENGHAEPISAVHSLAKHNSGENIPRDSRSSKIAKITALFETKASTEDGELAAQKKQKPTRKPARGIMQHLLMFEQNTESGDQLDDLLKTPAQSKSTQSNIDCSDTTRRESQDWDTDDGTNEGLPASASLDDGLLAESCSRRVALDPIEEQEKQKSSRVASFKRKVSSKRKDKQAKQEQESKTTISLALKSLHHAPQPQSGKNAVLYGSKQAKCDQAFKPSKSVCIANNTTTTMHMDRKAASAPPPSSRQPVVPQSSTSCSSASNQQHEQDEYSDLAVMRSMTSERSNSIASILSDDEAPVPFRKRLSNVVSTCSRDSVSSLCISSSSPPPLAETCYILQRSLDVATSVTRVTSVTSVTGDGCGSSSSQTNIPTSPVLRAAQQADDSATCSTDGQTLQQCQIPASANCSDSESSPKSTGGIVKSEPRLSSDQQQPSDMQQQQEEEQKPVLVATMSNSGAGVAGAGLAGAGLASAGLASAGASETHTTGSSGMAMSPSSSLSSVGSDILQVSAACSAASFWNGKVVSLSDALPVACLSSTITSSAAAISAPTATNTSSTAAVSAPTATSTSSTASPTTATSAAATASSSNTASIASASFLDSCAVQSLPLSDTSSSEPVADMVDRVVPTQDVGAAAAAAETGSSPPPVPTSADSSQQPPIVLHRACTVAGEAPTGLPLAMVLDEDSNRQHGLPVCTCPKLTAIASNCPVHSGRRLSSPSDPAVAMDAAFDAPPVIIHHRRRSSLLSDTDNDSVLSIPMRRHSGSDTATAGTSRLDANGYESGSSWDTDEDCNKRSPFNPSYASDTDEECNKAAIDDPVFINHSDISVSASPADMAAATATNSTSLDRKRSSEDAAPSRRLSKQLKMQSPVDEDYDIDNDDDAVFTVAPVAAASLPAYEFTTKHRRESVQSQPPSDISPMASTTTATVLKLKSTARQHQSLVGFSLDQVTDTLPSMRTVGAASDNAAEKTVEDDNDQVDRHLPLTNSSSASGVGLMRLRFRSLKNFNKAASHESDGDGRGSQDPSPTSTDKHRRQAKSQKVKASSRSSLASLKTNESNDEKAHRSTSVRARILRIRSSKKKSPPKIQPTASEPTVSAVNGDAGDEPAAAADADSTAGHVLSVGKHKNLNARHSDPGGPFEASPGSPSTPALSLLSLGKSILKSTSSLISLATGGSQTPAAASTNSSSTGENINASIVASTPATDSERSTAAAAAAAAEGDTASRRFGGVYTGDQGAESDYDGNKVSPTDCDHRGSNPQPSSAKRSSDGDGKLAHGIASTSSLASVSSCAGVGAARGAYSASDDDLLSGCTSSQTSQHSMIGTVGKKPSSITCPSTPPKAMQQRYSRTSCSSLDSPVKVVPGTGSNASNRNDRISTSSAGHFLTFRRTSRDTVITVPKLFMGDVNLTLTSESADDGDDSSYLTDSGSCPTINIRPSSPVPAAPPSAAAAAASAPANESNVNATRAASHCHTTAAAAKTESSSSREDPAGIIDENSSLPSLRRAVDDITDDTHENTQVPTHPIVSIISASPNSIAPIDSDGNNIVVERELDDDGVSVTSTCAAWDLQQQQQVLDGGVAGRCPRQGLRDIPAFSGQSQCVTRHHANTGDCTSPTVDTAAASGAHGVCGVSGAKSTSTTAKNAVRKLLNQSLRRSFSDPSFQPGLLGVLKGVASEGLSTQAQSTYPDDAGDCGQPRKRRASISTAFIRRRSLTWGKCLLEGQKSGGRKPRPDLAADGDSSKPTAAAAAATKPETRRQSHHVASGIADMCSAMVNKAMPGRSQRAASVATTTAIDMDTLKVSSGTNSELMEHLRPLSPGQQVFADALWDYVGESELELSFKAGELLEIMDSSNEVWWWASDDSGSTGYVPSNHLHVRTIQNEIADVVDESSAENVNAEAPSTCDSPQASTPKKSRKLSPEEMRARVVAEIVQTEKGYNSHLQDIVEGYQKRTRERVELFDEDQIIIIFSNVADLLTFQSKFLVELCAAAAEQKDGVSCIGHVFADNQQGFNIYSEYCNNHPYAVEEMSSLQEDPAYKFFFEACRLIREMAEISLEGFLLTPVQKICKYPLQLSELLKYTPEGHPDHENVKAAQVAMKKVALLINDRKARVEKMEKLARWQSDVLDWDGPDVLTDSTMVVYDGVVNRITKGPSQPRHLFLLDNQLIWCKKDTISRRLHFRRRLPLEDCSIMLVDDNEGVKHAWKISYTDATRTKWYVLQCRSDTERDEWMNAFQREREQAHLDQYDADMNSYLSHARRAVQISLKLGLEGNSKERSWDRSRMATVKKGPSKAPPTAAAGGAGGGRLRPRKPSSVNLRASSSSSSTSTKRTGSFMRKGS